MIKTFITTSLTLFICFIVFTNNLQAKEPARVIAGWVEKVRVNGHDFEVKAKP